MRVLCSYRSKRHVALSFLSQQRLTGLTGRALGIGRHIWDIPRSASTEIAKVRLSVITTEFIALNNETRIASIASSHISSV